MERVPDEQVRGWRLALDAVRLEFEDAYLRHRAKFERSRPPYA